MKKLLVLILCFSIIGLFGCKPNISKDRTSDKKDNTSTIASSASVYDEQNPLAIKNLNGHCSGITEDEEYIYYCSEDGINKADKKSGKSQVIFKQEKVGDLVLNNKYLYFLTEYGENFKVFRVDIDGKNYSQVFDGTEIKEKSYSPISIRNYSISDNMMYIKIDYQLFQYEMTSGNAKLIVDDVYTYSIVNGYVYYLDRSEKTFTIYKKNLKNMKSEIVLGKGVSKPQKDLYSEFAFVGDQMYFSTRVPDGVYYYNNGKPVKISKEPDAWVSVLLEYQGDIYYVLEGDGKKDKLIKYNVSTKNTEVIAEFDDFVSSYSFKIVNGYVYYSNIDNVAQSVKLAK